MKRVLWPGIVFVLVGSLVVLHAITLVFASTAGAPPVVTTSVGDARPRTGWHVDVTAAGGVLAVRLADAGGRAIDDAEVRVVGVAGLAHVGAGRYEAPLPGPSAGRGPCRVEVRRGGSAWTFDRVVEVPDTMESAP